jgi:hypothetical protein
MWATSLHSASSGYHAEFHEDCYQKHTNPLNYRTSRSVISGSDVDFHERHGAVGEWHGRGMGAAWHVLCFGVRIFSPMAGSSTSHRLVTPLLTIVSSSIFYCSSICYVKLIHF